MPFEQILLLVCIICGSLAIITTAIVLVKIYVINHSKNKLNLRKVKIGEEYYELYPANNRKGLKAMELTVLDSKNKDSIKQFNAVDEVSTDVTRTDIALPKIEEDEESITFTKANIKVDKRNKTVFLFSNIGEPFLKIYCYKNSKLEKMIKIALADYQVEQGNIVNVQKLANAILNEDLKLSNIDLILQINESFKNIISLPKMSVSKAKALYTKELKNDFPQLKQKFLIFSTNVKHSLGHVYYTYFIPNSIIDNFKKLAVLLNVKIDSVNLFGNYLAGLANLEIKGDYAGIHVKDNICTMFNSFGGVLAGIDNFVIKKPEQIVKKYLVMTAKHEIELERKKTTTCILDIEDEMSIDLYGIKSLEYYFNFETYFNNGIKL